MVPGASMFRQPLVPCLATRLVHLALLVFILLCQGCGSAGESEGEWFAPRLEQLDVLVLRWRGNIANHFRVQLFDDKGNSIEEHDLDAKNAVLAGRGEKRITLSLNQALWQPMKVTLAPLSGEGKRVSFSLTPKKLIQDLVSPLPAPKSEQMKRLLNEITDLRVEYANQRVKDRIGSTLKARRKLAKILTGAGLTEKYVKKLRQQLRKMEAPATTSLARKLLPLRYVEAVIGEIRGLLPPFGNLSTRLGYSFSRDEELGWKILAEEEVAKVVPSPDVPDKELLQWNWMATEKFLAPMRGLGPEGMAMAMNRLVFIAPGEAGVRPETIKARKTFKLQAKGKLNLAQVKEARLDIFARHFDRERLVIARLNGGPPMPIVNTAYHDTRRVARFHYHTFWWHLRLPLGLLRAGENEVELEVKVLPHEAPRLPLRLKTIRLVLR